MNNLQKHFDGWTGPALSGALIGVALLTIFAALVIKNKWIKAGILAYEILP